MGAPSAATAASVSRTRAGNGSSRSATTLCRLSGRESGPLPFVDRPVGERAPQLERVERVPAGRLVYAHEGGTRQVQRQPFPENPVDRADGERPGREPFERCEGAVELERRGDRPSAHRRENAGRLAVEPAKHEPEHLARAGVDPLRVVEREQQRRSPAASARTTETSASPSTRTSGRRSVRLARGATRSRARAAAPAPAAAAPRPASA